jgi:hypothetical protein
MTHRESSTRIELKSLTQRSECAGTESGCLRMLSECLCDSSVCLGVPFIAPRQLGAVGDQSRKAKLAFCRVVHRTVRCTTGQSLQLSGARSPSFSGVSTVGPRGQLVQRTLSGAPCRPLARATRRPRIARLTVALATIGSPDSPVNYNRTPLIFSRERPFHRRPAWRSGHCPVHHRTVWCARLS